MLLGFLAGAGLWIRSFECGSFKDVLFSTANSLIRTTQGHYSLTRLKCILNAPDSVPNGYSALRTMTFGCPKMLFLSLG